MLLTFSLFLLLLFFAIFSVYPVLRTLYLSFTNYKGFGSPVFIGLKNYIRVFGDKFFWISFLNTIKIWGLNIVVQLGLAFLLTIVFSDIRYKMKGLSIFRAIYYLPNLISAVSVAFLFKTLLDWKYGSINQILMAIGLTKTPINWLGQVTTAPNVTGLISALDVVRQFFYYPYGRSAGHS
jgi:multiple sugar transport system permease protein